ncbi:MAG: hypothetical protein MI919_23850, partial [Holophagales bacterium]|nr:hypothetical protein [Holophagales bacterium]
MIRQLPVLLLVLSLSAPAHLAHASEHRGSRAELADINQIGWDWIREDEEASYRDQDFLEIWQGALDGDFEGTLDRLEGSDLVWSHVLRAMALGGLEQHDLARVEAARAIERAPSRGRLVSEAHNQLGLALMRPVLARIGAPADRAAARA